MDMTQLLLMSVCGLLALLFGFLAWWGAGVSRKIDALSMHREGCVSRFADKENNSNDHRRMWKVLDEQKTMSHGHEIRIASLEQRMRDRA